MLGEGFPALRVARQIELGEDGWPLLQDVLPERRIAQHQRVCFGVPFDLREAVILGDVRLPVAVQDHVEDADLHRPGAAIRAVDLISDLGAVPLAGDPIGGDQEVRTSARGVFTESPNRGLVIRTMKSTISYGVKYCARSTL